MKNQYFDNKTEYNIFVSSTFQDMQYERDLLHEKIFPELNQYVLSMGKTITMTDLRWGINTDNLESSARKILSICFHSIDVCRPYMIVLLGDRYGWVPDRKLTMATIPTDYRDDTVFQDKSITHMEIEVRFT